MANGQTNKPSRRTGGRADGWTGIQKQGEASGAEIGQTVENHFQSVIQVMIFHHVILNFRSNQRRENKYEQRSQTRTHVLYPLTTLFKGKQYRFFYIFMFIYPSVCLFSALVDINQSVL